MSHGRIARSRASFAPREDAPREAEDITVVARGVGSHLSDRTLLGTRAPSHERTELMRCALVPESGTYPRPILGAVLRHPHPRLAARADEVDPTHPDVRALAERLVLTMRAAPACVGLAATQIGVPLHVFCMDVSGHRRARSSAGLVVLANARIVWRNGEAWLREGCLSVPHFTGNVLRAAEVEVCGVDPRTGRRVALATNGIEARCVQHELDHLDGLVFVDRVADPSRDLFPRKTYA